MPDTPRGGRGVLWAAGGLAVCCTVHALLLTGGLAGIGAALSVAAGNTVLAAAAGAVLATLAGAVLARHLRRPTPPRRSHRPPTDPQRQERL
ncbi:hypothetical protein [Actinoplanes sp. NPDC049316]|uniref:hypothetical protein n=1 Tax=Actinoplanes sp. NPDC049316 TaxID=3154727 RepID=UPI003431C572